MSSICEVCESGIFSSTEFPKIFVGRDLDEAPGIHFQTIGTEVEESASAGCDFCALIREHIVKTNDLQERKINLSIYREPIDARAIGAAVSDISKLFIDASPLGSASFFVYADEGKSNFILYTLRYTTSYSQSGL